MDESPSDHDTHTTLQRTSMQRATAWGRARAERVKDRFATLREHVAIVDVGARVYERDKEAGGTMLGSARGSMPPMSACCAARSGSTARARWPRWCWPAAAR